MQKYLLSLLAVLMFSSTAQAAVNPKYRAENRQQMMQMLQNIQDTQVGKLQQLAQQIGDKQPTTAQRKKICTIFQDMINQTYDLYDTNRKLFAAAEAQYSRTQFLQQTGIDKLKDNAGLKDCSFK